MHIYIYIYIYNVYCIPRVFVEPVGAISRALGWATMYQSYYNLNFCIFFLLFSASVTSSLHHRIVFNSTRQRTHYIIIIFINNNTYLIIISGVNFNDKLTMYILWVLIALFRRYVILLYILPSQMKSYDAHRRVI